MSYSKSIQGTIYAIGAGGTQEEPKTILFIKDPEGKRRRITSSCHIPNDRQEMALEGSVRYNRSLIEGIVSESCGIVYKTGIGGLTLSSRGRRL